MVTAPRPALVALLRPGSGATVAGVAVDLDQA